MLGIPSEWLPARRTMGWWACYSSLIFKEREASVAHLFQCWATGLNGIKTHCERGRNWAIRVFTEISSMWNWGKLELNLSQLEECPKDTSKFMAKPEEGGKGPPFRQLNTVKGKSFTSHQDFCPKHVVVKNNPRKTHQIYFRKALCRFSISLPNCLWMPQRQVYKIWRN